MTFAPSFQRVFRSTFDRAGAGITWLLRDDFTDTLAAGSVNGTAATPGPGTRTVVDTNTVMSISGGYIVTSGAVANGNPGLWYGALTRTLGRILVASHTEPNGTDSCEIGWDTGQSGAHDENSLRFISEVIQIKPSLTSVGVYGVNDITKLAIVLKSIGAYYFYRPHGTTIWKLLYIDTTKNTASIYPGVISVAATGTLKSDFIRVPTNLWLPTALAYDTFTRADGALGSTETVGPDGSAAPAEAVTARAWTEQRGTWAVSSGKMIPVIADGARCIATIDTGTENYQVSFSGTIGATYYLGISAKYVDINNRISLYIDRSGGGWFIAKFVGGTLTTLSTGVLTYSAGAVLVATCDGTSYDFYYNNAKLGASITISDVVFSGVTTIGVITNDVISPATIDNFLVMPRGNGGEYAALDAYIA